jgi:hypothetical protein
MEGRMIGAWFMARLMPIGIGVAVMVALFAWDYVRIQKAETRGADSAIVKVEKNNARVSSAARNAGRKSLDPQSGGVLNPYYRD